MTRRTLQPAWRLAFVLTIGALPAVAMACGDSLGAETELGTSLAAVQQDGIAGTWQINREASDPPPGRDGTRQDQFDGQRHGGRGGPPGRGGGGGRMGRGPGGRGGAGPIDSERGLLTIVVEDGSVTLTRGNGQAVRLPTDGQTVTLEGARGGEIAITASWDGDALVVERTVPKGSRTETFALSPDGTQLVVVTTMTGDQFDGTREHRRVYDQITSS